MTLSLQHLEEHNHVPGSDVSVIRREFVELTGNLFSAVILNQLLYWTLRVKDFDYLLEEEKKFQPNCNVSPRHGWIYKTAQELNEETMLGLSPPSIRKYLKLLIDEGWIDERNHPTEKWDRTTQYRVNLRRLQEDLIEHGLCLPEVYLKAFRSSLDVQRNFEKPKENPNERNFASGENPEGSGNEEPHFSKENLNQRNFTSNQKIFASNEKFFGSNTENTTENTNKEKLAIRTHEENFATGSDSDKSLVAEMLCHWKRHVVETLIPLLTERGHKPESLQLKDEQKNQLESLFSFHFNNDIRLWERFCLRVKASSFLMGGGIRKWYVRLDWLLREDNISKVLNGKYDNSNRTALDDCHEGNAIPTQPNPAQEAEKEAILNSITDPVWKKWCTKLADGVRYNEHKMLHEPLSVLELEQIANASFLECEEGRLVWIGSSDPSVLNKIEDLRLKIRWVIEEDYPDARAIRTRLLRLEDCSQSPWSNQDGEQP